VKDVYTSGVYNPSSVDNISVPEPSTVGILGLGLLGLMSRKNKVSLDSKIK